MTTWRDDIKPALIAFLEAVRVVDPFDPNKELAAEAVYPNPPESIEEDFALVVFPPAMTTARHNALRHKTYVVRVRLLVNDEYPGDAIALVDVMREAIVDAADASVTLEGLAGAEMLSPLVEEGDGWPYGDKAFVGCDFRFTIQLHEARTFGP